MNDELTILRDGSQVPTVTIGPIMISLQALLEERQLEGVIACFELRELCRNPGHQLFAGSGDLLKDYALIDVGGLVHDVTRDVVLNAVIGEMVDMALQWPIEPSGTSDPVDRRATTS